MMCGLEGFLATKLEGSSFSSWQELKPLAASAEAALAAVHKAGVLHGDLRPSAFCHAGWKINKQNFVQLTCTCEAQHNAKPLIA